MCGEILVAQKEIPATGHTEVVIPGKPATCEEAGLTEGKKCSVCGEILVAQKEIPATGHTEQIIPGKPATCGEDGLTDGVVCAVCGKVLVEQEVIPAALAHEPVVIPGKPATCEEEGLTDGEICSICGTILKEQEVIPPLGHEIVTVPGKAPTCTKTGLTEGEKCAVCGKVIKAQTVIPALGHNWKKQEPTSLLRTEYICRRCGMRHYTNEKNSIRNYYGSILINANGKYVDYIASVDPKNDAGLVITAVIKPTAPGWTSEIGLYLTKDLIKQIKGDGFEYITYVNDSAALTFVLNGIDETMFETAEAINQYAFITDPKAENGCLVKVEGVTETGRFSAAEFAPMELVIKGQKIKVTKEGNYKPE